MNGAASETFWARGTPRSFVSLEGADHLLTGGNQAKRELWSDLLSKLRRRAPIRRQATVEARRHWEAFPRSAKRAILEWIASGKRALSSTKRIEKTVARTAAGRRASQWGQREATPPT